MLYRDEERVTTAKWQGRKINTTYHGKHCFADCLETEPQFSVDQVFDLC